MLVKKNNKKVMKRFPKNFVPGSDDLTETVIVPEIGLDPRHKPKEIQYSLGKNKERNLKTIESYPPEVRHILTKINIIIYTTNHT